MFKIPGEASDARNQQSIPIRGLQGDLPVRFAPNGGAVPGDRIVGILTPGEGITIYPIQSPDLTAFDEQPERWLDVRWDIEDGRQDFFPARIVVTAINEPGTLGTIATVIGDHAANIDNIVINPLSADFREMIIDVEVNDLKHLNSDHFAFAGSARGQQGRAGERIMAALRSLASRRQYRSRRDLAQRAGRRFPRSGARRTSRHRSRRRRNYRAFARGSAPHPRRGHGAAETGDFETARISRWRRPTTWWRSLSIRARMHAVSSRKNAASARPKAASTSSVATII